MADTAAVEQVNGTATETQGNRTFTQAELDDIVQTRLSKERAKYSDYEELKAKALKFDEAEEAGKSELQKATEKVKALQTKLDSMTKEAEVAKVRSKIANDTGVPASLLSGTTEEECLAQATSILAFAKPGGYPNVKDGGELQTPAGKKTEQDQFADWFNASIGKN